jgi:hypothetical protein
MHRRRKIFHRTTIQRRIIHRAAGTIAADEILAAVIAEMTVVEIAAEIVVDNLIGAADDAVVAVRAPVDATCRPQSMLLRIHPKAESAALIRAVLNLGGQKMRGHQVRGHPRHR